jgi:hypothetical protein
VSRNSIGARLERLEDQIGPPVDKETALRQAVMRDVMKEFGHLKASRAIHYRGGPGGLTRIEPEDIPGKVLGPTYTTGEMMQLVIRRMFECEEVSDVEELVVRWTPLFEAFFARAGRDWNKMEGEG